MSRICFIYLAFLCIASARPLEGDSLLLKPELVDKHGISRLPVRKGDTVYVTRGAFRDSEGDVQDVDMKKGRIHVENISTEKADGSAIPLPIAPSSVMITKLSIDKTRQAVIDRKVAARLANEKEED